MHAEGVAGGRRACGPLHSGQLSQNVAHAFSLGWNVENGCRMEREQIVRQAR
jgi:hypothetical protein